MKKCIAFFAFIAIVSSAAAAEFADKDTDKDGKISLEEFAGKDKKLAKKFKSLDKNKDGSLCEKEFSKTMKKKKKSE
ncbi:MAG: hypothetical protein NE327_15165 [Lentisphaeraceae bacterium]|nr:hypothetical protein [Lentisphaeraceae bacterium]